MSGVPDNVPSPGRRFPGERPAGVVSRRGLLHAAGAGAAAVGGGGLLDACSSSKGTCDGSTSGCASGLVIGPSGDATGAADTAAINAVVGAGGTALLKNRTYYVTHLLPDSYGAILGAGAGTILRAVSGTTGYMIALKTPASTQVMLRDLVLVPNTGTLGGIQFDNTGLNASPMHVLTNVQVQGAGGDGFHFDNDANGLHLYDCLARNSGGYGFYLGIGCTDSHFVSCTAAVSANHGWLVGGWNNMFTTCKSYYSGNRGGNTGRWETTQAGFYLSSCRNNTFVGCCAQNNALHGFDLQSTVNCTITGCETDGNNQGRAGGVGINTKACTYCSIVGNTGSNIGTDPQLYGLQLAGAQTGTEFIGNSAGGTSGATNFISASGYLYVDAVGADFSGLSYFRIPSPVLSPAGAQALHNGSTISAHGYSVIPLTATGNVTALILSPPPNGWTQLTLINQSAFTLTFDLSGTSNVADGTSDVIPANSARTFIYDGNTRLWYRAG